MRTIQAVLFDKDGTILDFHQTWDAAVGQGLRGSAADAASLARAAKAIEFDLEGDRILPGSPLIAEANDVIAGLLEPFVDPELCFAIAGAATIGTATPADGLPGVFHDLRAVGLTLAIVTNDYESIAGEQLAGLGWSSLFDKIVGSDSGFGAKPDPGMITGALGRLEIEPERAVVVGDTAHDLHAGRGAGVKTVLVTNDQDPEPPLLASADWVVTSLNDLLPSFLERDLV